MPPKVHLSFLSPAVVLEHLAWFLNMFSGLSCIHLQDKSVAGLSVFRTERPTALGSNSTEHCSRESRARPRNASMNTLNSCAFCCRAFGLQNRQTSQNNGGC